MISSMGDAAGYWGYIVQELKPPPFILWIITIVSCLLFAASATLIIIGVLNPGIIGMCIVGVGAVLYFGTVIGLMASCIQVQKKYPGRRLLPSRLMPRRRRQIRRLSLLTNPNTSGSTSVISPKNPQHPVLLSITAPPEDLAVAPDHKDDAPQQELSAAEQNYEDTSTIEETCTVNVFPSKEESVKNNQHSDHQEGLTFPEPHCEDLTTSAAVSTPSDGNTLLHHKQAVPSPPPDPQQETSSPTSTASIPKVSRARVPTNRLDNSPSYRKIVAHHNRTRRYKDMPPSLVPRSTEHIILQAAPAPCSDCIAPYPKHYPNPYEFTADPCDGYISSTLSSLQRSTSAIKSLNTTLADSPSNKRKCVSEYSQQQCHEDTPRKVARSVELGSTPHASPTQDEPTAAQLSSYITSTPDVVSASETDISHHRQQDDEGLPTSGLHSRDFPSTTLYSLPSKKRHVSLHTHLQPSKDRPPAGLHARNVTRTPSSFPPSHRRYLSNQEQDQHLPLKVARGTVPTKRLHTSSRTYRTFVAHHTWTRRYKDMPPSLVPRSAEHNTLRAVPARSNHIIASYPKHYPNPYEFTVDPGDEYMRRRLSSLPLSTSAIRSLPRQDPRHRGTARLTPPSRDFGSSAASPCPSQGNFVSHHRPHQYH